MTEIRVAIVEDNRKTAEYLRALLDGTGGIGVTGTYTTVAEALDGIPPDPPDVALVDLNLPDGSGVDLIKALRKKARQMKY